MWRPRGGEIAIGVARSIAPKARIRTGLTPDSYRYLSRGKSPASCPENLFRQRQSTGKRYRLLTYAGLEDGLAMAPLAFVMSRPPE